MTTYRLDRLFAPRSVAVVGASPRERSVGRSILRNLKDAQFPGPIRLVNPRHGEIEGIAASKSVADLPETDLLIVTSPPESVPDAIAAAGARGTAGAVIVTSGLGEGPDSLNDRTERAARAHGMRLIGPNCLGIQVPSARLNASFAARMSRPGDLALISQSGAVAAGLAEWAAQRAIGFSGLISLGNQIDVDIADMIDYYAADRATRTILLYIESIRDARKFMSAARAAARLKPVVVVKSGRHSQGAAAARTHTGALAGSDSVYDAAFRRVGLVRVFDLDELFDAAETLGHLRPFPGNRLAILTNGGGIGVLAVDRLMDLGGKLADVSPELMAKLDRVLPPIWSKANPIDISGDADGARYTAAMQAVLADPGNDAVLAMNVATALAPARDAAEAVATTVREHQGRRAPPKPVFAVWVGGTPNDTASFEAARIPNYRSEADAIRSFMHLVRYSEGIDALMRAPPSLPSAFNPDTAAARQVVRRAVAEGRTWLDPLEIDALMAAYAIPIAAVALARDVDEAATVAKRWLGEGPVALKILSPDIVHKSDVDGVRLNLRDVTAVREAATGMLARARELRPAARIAGVTVHPMIVRPKARELIAGLADDPTFGPVIVFGAGGTAVEVIADKALALPPLDLALARDLIGRTRVSRILHAYRDVPAADLDAVALVLVKLATMAAEIPEIRELDLNPLLAGAFGVIALDARVAVAPAAGEGAARFAIRPYPKQWERTERLRDGSEVLVRPVKPDDEPLYPPFLGRINAEDLRLRFFASVKEFSHTFIARFTQIDYARAMAFVTIDPSTGEMLGVGRLHISRQGNRAEYAVLVRSDLKGRGLGWLLMQRLIEYARREDIAVLHGEVLAENTTMLRMCAELGFRIADTPDDPTVRHVELNVADVPPMPPDG